MQRILMIYFVELQLLKGL